MPKYQIRKLEPDEEKLKNAIKAAIGVRPKSITYSMLVEVTEIEMPVTLTADQLDAIYEIVTDDERVKRRAVRSKV